MLSSRFLTEKKSEELITKLSALTSKAQAQNLKRQISVADRPKSINEQSYYSVDATHTAINEGRKITFKYFDYDVRKKRIYRKDGALYQVTPITLCWDSDKYYLVAYSVEHNELRNYRVDRLYPHRHTCVPCSTKHSWRYNGSVMFFHLSININEYIFYVNEICFNIDNIHTFFQLP